MATPNRCLNCGAALTDDARQGYCPKCLFRLAGVGTLRVSPPDEEEIGTSIGRYKLLERLGEGGFGTVYVAEQREPVKRRVALKIIKLGMDTRAVIARFEAERQALALMEHPNIAKVLDGGATETGRPYFVMELVRGMRITDYCDQNNLSTEQRLGLFMQVCHAIQHAHQKGIIHRDVKPSNILVTVLDGQPVPKVIDFGIAKATQGQLTDKTVYTQLHQFIGTPAYMSPEQAVLSAVDVDTRSDIYSLGVLLYELLTGHTPFDAKTLVAAGLDEMRRIVREQEPPRPSTRISTLDAAERTAVAKHRQAEPGALSRLVRGDLDWIVMKCLEKERGRRYETANNVALDVQHHLNQEPVMAAAPSALYRAGKFVRRHKAGLATAMGLVLLLAGGVVASTWQAVRATRAERQQERLRQQAQTAQARAETQERKARAEAAKSQQVSRFLQDTLQNVAAVAFRDRAILGNILDATTNRIGQELKNQPEVEAELRTAVGHTYSSLGRAPEAEAMYREALAIQKRLFGNEHPSVAASLVYVANVLSLQGIQTEAEKTLREAIAMDKKLLSNEHPNVANALADLAGVLVIQSQTAAAPLKQRLLAEAEELQRETLAIRRKLFGNEHVDVAQSLDGLALVFHAQGKTAEAERGQREALAMRRKLLGDENLAIAMSLLNLADVLSEAGKYAEAEPLYRDALAMRRKLLGNEDPNVAYALGHLAVLLQRQNKLAEAEAANREALAINRNVLGNEHPHTIVTLNQLAGVLRDEGKLTEAEALRHEAREARQRFLDNERDRVYWSLIDSGRGLLTEGKLAQAEAAFRQVLERMEQLLERKETARAVESGLTGLAEVLRRQGRNSEAGALVPDMMRVADRTRDTNQVAALYSRAIELLADSGRHEQVEVLGRKLLALSSTNAWAYNNSAWFLATTRDAASRHSALAVQLADKAVAASNRREPPILDTLAAAYAAAGQYTNAVKVQQEAIGLLTSDEERRDYGSRLNLFQKNLPYHDHGRLAQRATELLVAGRFAEAEPLARESLALREKLIPEDWRTFNARSMLGGSLLGQKKYAEAESLLVAGYEGMKQREDKIPVTGNLRVKEALQRLVQLYEATSRPEKAAAWRQKLAEADTPAAAKQTGAP